MKQLKHKWGKRVYNKEVPKFKQVCETCGCIKTQMYKPPYEIEYIDIESGEVTTYAINCKEKISNQLNLFKNVPN